MLQASKLQLYWKWLFDKNSELPSYNFTENDVENDVVDKNS